MKNTKLTPTNFSSGMDRKRIIAILAASSGNLVEWFDFYVYSFCAIYFAPIFFPTANPTVQLLNTAGVFAAGFLARPIGGWIFGHIADKHGRKKSLIISIMMMCVGSLVIACVPGYNSIGLWAPALLLVARLFQGFSVGGEYGATATYMSEVAIHGRRGFYSSFQYVTLIGGQLLAVTVVVILQQVLTESELKTWGWRIPFAIGAIAAVLALFLRRTLTETTSMTKRSHKDAGSVGALFRDHKAAFFTVVGYTAGGSLCFYTFTTYMQKYLANSVHIPVKTASNIMTGCLLVFMLMQPIFGALSDRIGRRNHMLLFGALGAIGIVPILSVLQHTTEPFYAACLVMLALIITSFYTSVAAIVKAEMFPIKMRALGVGLSYAIANTVFGGSAEYVALRFKVAGYESSFYWYVTVMLVITFFVSLRLPKEPLYLSDEKISD